jgi:DNA-binding LytR/AlgR family response regulator
MNTNSIILKIGNKNQKVFLRSILFISVHGKYCKVHTRTKVYSVKSSLSNLYNQTRDCGFAKLGRSALFKYNKLNAFRLCEIFVDKHHFPLEKSLYMKVHTEKPQKPVRYFPLRRR